jgi:Signal peptidase, peptidase S26
MGNTVYEEDQHWVAFTPGAGEFRDFGPVKLANDEFFLLGDNRDNSLDCRTWGPLKEDAIRGKVIFTMATGPRLKRPPGFLHTDGAVFRKSPSSHQTFWGSETDQFMNLLLMKVAAQELRREEEFEITRTVSDKQWSIKVW